MQRDIFRSDAAADGHFWNGIVFIGAGTSLSSATAIYRKENVVPDADQGKDDAN